MKYKKDESLKRLKEIKKLKEKKLTIKEIIAYFGNGDKKDKSYLG
jgi:DNA-binding transcriptional MerR regulator